jgi:hypothetical protein
MLMRLWVRGTVTWWARHDHLQVRLREQEEPGICHEGMQKSQGDDLTEDEGMKTRVKNAVEYVYITPLADMSRCSQYGRKQAMAFVGVYMRREYAWHQPPPCHHCCCCCI